MQIQPSPPSQSASMENRRKNSSSGDSFSFPSTPNQEDSDFEFGSLTPDSPSCTTSPADHLFFNGRLQPHSFPLSGHSSSHHHLHPPLAATSRTSSISSKDSFLSSRSNSTSSSCSSARTSSSDSSERRLFHNKVLNNRSTVSGHHFHQPYGCSRRWQYITPVPALNRDASKRKTMDMPRGMRRKNKTKKLKKKKDTVKRVSAFRFGRRIFRWLFTACRKCHAMEPSKTKAHNKEKMLQEGNSNSGKKNQVKTQNISIQQ